MFNVNKPRGTPVIQKDMFSYIGQTDAKMVPDGCTHARRVEVLCLCSGVPMWDLDCII
jgi:hypothetical protein